MGSFLDKIGLQHFVEKIKSLLSGYLPLSGGTMTGGIVYTDKATLNGDMLKYDKVDDNKEYNSSIRPDVISVTYKGLDDTYGNVVLGATQHRMDGLHIIMVSNKKSGTANFTAQKCENKRFVLSIKDKDSENNNVEQVGLIANNSTKVVKELSDDQVDKLLAGDTSVIDGSKYYVSGANLGRFAQNVAKDNSYTIIYAEYGPVEVKTSNGNVTVEPGISTRIDEICPVVSGQDNVTSLVYKGYAPDKGLSFNYMENLKTIDVFDLNTSNVTDMSAYFSRCSTLSSLGMVLPLLRDIKYWDTRKVLSFEGMFTGCILLTSVDLRYWSTQKVINMALMFANCTKLTNLNLEGWDTRSVNTMEGMFKNCKNMSSLLLGEGFGRMQDYVGTVDFSMMSNWKYDVESLTKLYDRKVNGMGVITLKLSVATKSALGNDGIRELTDKGYTIA